MKRLFLLALLWGSSGCRSTPPLVVNVMPVRIEPRGQLVVATRTDNVSFEETVTRDLLAKWVQASALIRVEANLSFDYYFDFREDRAQVVFDAHAGSAQFAGGKLRVKKPVINQVRVLLLEKSIWIDEEKAARRILERLTDRLNAIGSMWKNDPTVSNACETGLRDFLASLARDNHWDCKETHLAWNP